MAEFPFLRFSVSSAIASFLRASSAGAAAAELGVPTNEQLAAATSQKTDKFTEGRTLLTNSAVASGDFGTKVSLAGFTLSEGAASTGSQLLVKGPGQVAGSFGGTVTLDSGEVGVWISDASGHLDLLSLARLRRNLRTSGPAAPSAPLVGDEWFNTTTKRSFVYSDSTWIEQPFTTALEGFLYADGSAIVGAKAAGSAAVADTLALRGAEGEAHFTGTSGTALSGTYTSSASSTDKAGVAGTTNALGAYGVYGLHTGSGFGWGVRGHSAGGFGGVWGSGSAGIGVQGSSVTGTGGSFTSTEGVYHAIFGGNSGSDRCAIERLRGWLVWFRTYLGVDRKGRLKTADLTADRDWTLPDASGKVALTSQSDGSIKTADIADATTIGLPGKLPKIDEAGVLTAPFFFAPSQPESVDGAVLSSGSLTLFHGPTSKTVTFTTDGTALDDSWIYSVPNASGTLALTDNPAGIPDKFIPPTSDPLVDGMVWNNSGVLVISAGPPP